MKLVMLQKATGVFYKRNGKLVRIKDKGWQHYNN